MQIVRPDMLPLIAVIMFLFLFFVGILGLALLYFGIKTGKKNEWSIPYVSIIVLGCLSIGFVVYNWIGYNSIFLEKENLIVGEYNCGNAKLTINSDYTWRITGNNNSPCKSGKWEYVMSEDWCYWNIESENLRCRTQIGTPREGMPKTNIFKGQNQEYKRTNNHNIN